MLLDVVIGTSLMFIAIANIGLFLIAASAYNTLTKEEEKTPINLPFYSRLLDLLFLIRINVIEKIIDLSEYYTKTEVDGLISDAAIGEIDLSNHYTKTDTDSNLDLKTDKTDLIDAYTKTEDEALQLLKADKSTTYTKTETDTLLDANADKSELIDAYTKTEIDTKVDEKVDKTELDEYVDLTSASTISEVRDIATDKSKAYVFSTQEELNDWMAIQDNVANFAIGENLYIVDKYVTDNLLDGTDLKILETELPDMSNVITTLGTATGNGNAITDISIDRNTLTPAKNAMFVTTGFDQSITRMKTFTSTIISNGIHYQGYDNNSVFLAGGGVRTISDINASVNLTDYYNKTKTNELLGDKANSADLYNYYEKHDVDEMINDANELIRAVEDQIPPPATISNFVQKIGEELYYTIQRRLRQQLDKTLLFDSMSDNLYITKFDALEGLAPQENFTDQLLDKADKTDLNSYVTLDTAKSINANKTFNNACRFTSTIDRMSTITGTSFVKLGADDTVVLLGAGDTKPISEFVSAPTDLSNYYNKNEIYSKTEDDSKFALKADKTELIDDYTKTESDSKYIYVTTAQTIGGNKTFSLEDPVLQVLVYQMGL
ncbi:MAG: hypothetical protein EZS28_007641 [Streblomastix strix]|uniref:Uncharacterized protein n=1 Tax=Streblomastix strix TaxID=222440 RepID=A0A5J4WQ51_9EUKA|nr:MAG: hypothetical protein EZS28_007641 [Streblomastix strix]